MTNQTTNTPKWFPFTIIGINLLALVIIGHGNGLYNLESLYTRHPEESSKTEVSSEKEKEVVDVNGTYSYTEPNVESKVTISGARWSSEFCLLPPWCDVEREFGVIKDGRLYDSSGYLEVGKINVTGQIVTVSLTTANGYMTHRN